MYFPFLLWVANNEINTSYTNNVILISWMHDSKQSRNLLNIFAIKLTRKGNNRVITTFILQHLYIVTKMTLIKLVLIHLRVSKIAGGCGMWYLEGKGGEQGNFCLEKRQRKIFLSPFGLSCGAPCGVLWIGLGPSAQEGCGGVAAGPEEAWRLSEGWR